MALRAGQALVLREDDGTEPMARFIVVRMRLRDEAVPASPTPPSTPPTPQRRAGETADVRPPTGRT